MPEEFVCLILHDRFWAVLVWSNLNFLHNSQWITFPTMSYLVLYSFCAGVSHSPGLFWVVEPILTILWSRLVSNSYRKFSMSLRTFSSTSTTIDITVILMFHSNSFSFFFTPWEFFTSGLADGLSLKFVWRKVSLSIQDSSHYSSQFQLYSSLDGLHLSSYFEVLQSL